MTELLINPPTDRDELVAVEMTHPAHADMFKTLDLLCLNLAENEKLYFVVEGCSKFSSLDELRPAQEYFYEEHTCPTNFISIPLIVYGSDADPRVSASDK